MSSGDRTNFLSLQIQGCWPVRRRLQGVGYGRFEIVEGLALRKIRQPRLPSGGEPDERNISLGRAFFQRRSGRPATAYTVPSPPPPSLWSSAMAPPLASLSD